MPRLSQRRLALLQYKEEMAQIEEARRQARIAEASRVNAVEARRCPFCFRYKAASVALREQHERRCYRNKRPQLERDRVAKREVLRTQP